MRTITTFMLAVLLTACASCDKEPEAPPPEFRLELESVRLTPTPGHPSMPYKYEVNVLIYASGDYSGAAQEVTQTSHWQAPLSGNVFVEWFSHKGNEWHRDTHRGDAPSCRDMVIYPADIQDGNMLNGWTVLPQNIDGSVTTDPNQPIPAQNIALLPGNTMSGSITREDRSRALRWTIIADADGVTVILPTKTHREDLSP